MARTQDWYLSRSGAVSGDQAIESIERVGELVVVDPLDLDAVAPPDLFFVRKRLARESLGRGGDAVELGGEEARALAILEALRFVAQSLGFSRQLFRRGKGLRLDLPRQLGRSVVSVDDAIDVPPEPQAEEQIPANDALDRPRVAP